MAASEITVHVELERRGLLCSVARLPFVFAQHYRVSRSGGNGRIVSAYAAWLMC